MTVPVKTPVQGDIIEAVIAKGDLSKLTPDERNRYYTEVCRSIGLNPLTQPFQYITLNGKLTLYARRDAADQLRKINGISVEIVSQEQTDGLLTVHVRAKDQTGRQDEDLGVVSFPETLRGEARANAILKAVTKAKRRVTLSISGLGFLDETEIEDIPASAKRPAKPAPNVMLEPPHDPQTGEIFEPQRGDADPAPAPADQHEHREPTHPAREELVGNGAGAGLSKPPAVSAYVDKWRVIIDAATDAKQLRKAWNDDKAAREQIEWLNDATLTTLKNQVIKAIEFLKT